MALKRSASLIAVVALAGTGAVAWEGDDPPRPARAEASTAPDDPYSTRPRPGTLAFGATAADPDGGDDWTVRTWRPRGRRTDRDDPGREVACIQAGRLVDGRLVRTFASGGEREMRLGDRTVCLDTAGPATNVPPMAIERLADEPASPSRMVRTIAYGVAPPGVDRVTLAARARDQDVPLEATTRTFLAVLDGSVRRADLVVRMRHGSRTTRFDFGRGAGAGAIVPRSIQPGPQVADPLGGPPFAVRRYTLEETKEACVEAGRAIGDEVGPYDAGWGSFLDAPTLAHGARFEDGWAPTGAPPSETAACLEPEPAELLARTQRFDDRVAVVQGAAGRAVRSVALRGPYGRAHPVALRDGTFVGAVPSEGTLNEHAVLVATLANGRRTRSRLFLAPHDVPTRWTDYEVRRRGRVVRVYWGSAASPFSGADVRLGRLTARVTVYERYGPSHTDDGYAVGYIQPLISKCADIVLPAPLGGRRVRSGRPGGHVRPVGDETYRPPRCPRVRAGTRRRVSWEADG